MNSVKDAASLAVQNSTKTRVHSLQTVNECQVALLSHRGPTKTLRE